MEQTCNVGLSAAQTVSEFIMRTLKASGASTIFGYPGQSNLALLKAASRAGLRYVQTADERSAAFAATGYVQASASLTAVCVSKGPAVTNLLTSAVSARQDGVPFLIVSGNVSSDCRGRKSFQEFDPAYAFLAADAVKAAMHCPMAHDVPRALASLVQQAWTAPYGPVLLDLPDDLLGAQCLDPIAALPAGHDDPNSVMPIDAHLIGEVVTAIEAADRPLVIVGRGAVQDAAAVRRFCHRFQLPVVHTVGGAGVVAGSDRWQVGFLRVNGNPRAVRALQRADLVIALGTSFEKRAVGPRASFVGNARRIHVDVDSEVLARQPRPSLPICSRLDVFLAAMEGQRVAARSRADWLAECTPPEPTPHIRGDDVLTAQDIVRASIDVCPDAIVVKDSGTHKYSVTNSARCESPEQSIASCHFGAMGFGLPAAIGASLALPERTVIAVCGDGCVLMSLAELVTAAAQRCRNLKIVIFNNGGLGSTRDYEARTFSDGVTISDFGQHVPLATYAGAIGIESIRVTGRDDLAAMADAMQRPGLMLFDCWIDAAPSAHVLRAEVQVPELALAHSRA